MRWSQEIKAFAASHSQEYLEDLAKLIAVPSVSEERYMATAEAPFGIRCVEALQVMMDMCRGYGLETRTIGDVIGIAEYGQGERELDIVAHLDVQPAGEGWTTDPFKLTIDGDTLYGRGVSDDKGPALAALYAVRALKESGIPLKKKVRLVWGTGEEYAIQDIHYYTDAEPAPPFMFTPDHSYPLVNSCKAGYTNKMEASFIDDESAPGVRVMSLAAGNNRGAVPGSCEAQVNGADREALERAIEDRSSATGLPFHVDWQDGQARISCEGVSTHAVKADQGKNALTAMLGLLTALPLSDTDGHRMLRRFDAIFPHGDVEGRQGGLYVSDKESGGSLYNIGIFRYTPVALEVQLRATLPATTDTERFKDFFRDKMEDIGLSVVEENVSEGRNIPLDDPYVKKLMASYEFYTGEKAFGISAGGGDYSHHFPRGIAFGCEPYGVDTRMHGAQEFVSLENMLRSVCIFAQSIWEICG